MAWLGVLHHPPQAPIVVCVARLREQTDDVFKVRVGELAERVDSSFKEVDAPVHSLSRGQSFANRNNTYGVDAPHRTV